MILYIYFHCILLPDHVKVPSSIWFWLYADGSRTSGQSECGGTRRARLATTKLGTTQPHGKLDSTSGTKTSTTVTNFSEPPEHCAWTHHLKNANQDGPKALRTSQPPPQISDVRGPACCYSKPQCYEIATRSTDCASILQVRQRF
ncbi:hypothetical protein EV363DRAFT_1156536 [Boletus edulis]|nr:hypothetical protein EV363DRAFT_1156536 [Boletus edulis]